MIETSSRLSSSVRLVTDTIPLYQVHQEFARTEYGQRLRGNVRYDRFKPSHLLNQEWERLLGIDVNNYDHMGLSTQFTQQFLQLCRKDPFYAQREPQFSEAEEELLLLTAQTHDLVEGMDGFTDISYDQKTDQDESDELAKMTEVMQGAAALFTDQATDQAVLTQKLLAVPEILGDKTGRLGQAFNAIERLGYLRTGYRAWQVSQRIADPITRDSLRWITANVLANQTDMLLAYDAKYYPVKEFLRERHTGITEAFDSMPDSVFLHYGEEQQSQRDTFMHAKTRWHQASCYENNGIFPKQEKVVEDERVEEEVYVA